MFVALVGYIVLNCTGCMCGSMSPWDCSGGVMNGVCLRFDLIRVSESVACTEVEGKVYCM